MHNATTLTVYTEMTNNISPNTLSTSAFTDMSLLPGVRVSDSGGNSLLTEMIANGNVNGQCSTIIIRNTIPIDRQHVSSVLPSDLNATEFQSDVIERALNAFSQAHEFRNARVNGSSIEYLNRRRVFSEDTIFSRNLNDVLENMDPNKILE
jgi:hypothetical protein